MATIASTTEGIAREVDRPSFREVLRRRQGLLIGAISVGILIAAWQIIVNIGLVGQNFLTPPSQVVTEGYQLLVVKRSIYNDILVSLKEVAIGYGTAVVIGIVIGLISGRVRWFRQAIEPVVIAGSTMPAVAFLPLLIIWFGLGIMPKAILIFSGAIFAMILNTEAGVLNTDPRLIETARSFQADERTILRRVVLPSTVPYIMAGIRASIGRSIIMMVVAELFAANAGLGFFIINAGNTYDTKDVFVGVTLLSIMGIVLNRLARRVEAHYESWKGVLA